MISRLKDENKGIAIIVDPDFDDEVTNPYCTNCHEIGKFQA
jgi:hypothetical protein